MIYYLFIIWCFLFQTCTLGYTALHRAASWGHVDCLKVLVAQGCDIQIRNTHGERAREAAARYGQENCVTYLDKAGKFG